MLRSEVNSSSPWGANDADGSDYWWSVKVFHCVPVSVLLLAFALSTLSCRWFTITTVNCVFIQHFSDQFWAFQPLNIWGLHLPSWVSVTIQDSMCSSGPIYTFVYQDATWWAISALDISTLTCPLQRPGISPATFHHSTAEPQLLVDTKLDLQLKMIYLFAFYIRSSAYIFICGPTSWFPLMTVGVEPQS